MISVVTPTLNSARFVERTLRSIWGADGDTPRDDVEHIVVDGGSTDDTLAIVARYPSRVIAEPDGGMYEAVNKGLAAARGDLFGYVNSDDEVAPGALDAIAAAFRAHPEKNWLVGPMDLIDGEGARLATLRPPRLLSADRFRALGWSCLPQPSTYFRTSFARDLGGFDTAYQLVADYDFFIRALERERPAYASRTLSHFRLHDTNLSKDHSAMRHDAAGLDLGDSMAPARRLALRWITKLQVNLGNPGWALGKLTGRVRY